MDNENNMDDYCNSTIGLKTLKEEDWNRLVGTIDIRFI